MPEARTLKAAVQLSVRLVPVLPRCNLDLQRHAQLHDPFHLALHEGHHLVPFRLGDLEDQLVVDLHDHGRLRVMLLQKIVQVDHGDLDEIGRRALDGRVDGGALGELADGRIGAGDLGDVAPAVQQRADILVPACVSRESRPGISGPP